MKIARTSKTLRYLVMAALAAAMFFWMGQVAYADTYVAVTGSVVNVRSQPEIDPYNRITQVSRGTIINIVGVDGDFFRAVFPDIGYAYIAREWVKFYQTRGTVTSPIAWIFDLPDAYYGTATILATYEDYFTVVSYYGDWYGIMYNGQLMYIEKVHISVPDLIPVPPAAHMHTLHTVDGSVVEQVIEKALRYLGRPYRWGGNGPDAFDCSGFVIYVLRPFGVTLPRRSRDMASAGVYVSRANISPGDLLFFATAGGRTVSHVGLYIGGGQFIHSSSPRSGGVMISNLNSAYYTRTFVTARRVL